MDATLPYDSLAALRRALVAEVPHLARIDEVPENDWSRVPLQKTGDGRFPLCGRGFLPDQPDRPGLDADGRA